MWKYRTRKAAGALPVALVLGLGLASAWAGSARAIGTGTGTTAEPAAGPASREPCVFERNAGANAAGQADAPRRQPPLLRAFDEIDTDSSGTLTPEELAAHAERRFAAADTNGDGLLDQEELAASIRARMAARLAARNPGAAVGPGAAAGPGQETGQDAGQDAGQGPAPLRRGPNAERIAQLARALLQKRDRDGDSMLSAEEMQPPAAQAARLRALDTDGDGALSREELMAGRPPFNGPGER